MNKSSLVAIMLLSFLTFSMFGALATAQYNSDTTQVTIGSDGTFTGSAQGIGVAYEVQGTPGATGSITAQIYNGNPQPMASIPEGVSLTRFVVVTFNMDASDFTQAKIYITYTDEDVASLQAPFTVYKYIASSNSYESLPAEIDTESKMVTITVNSIDDPLFAIGGLTVVDETNGFSTTAWAILAVSIVIVVLLVVVGVWYLKRNQS